MTTSEKNYIKRLEMIVDAGLGASIRRVKIEILLSNFQQAFDIDRIKDRMDHVYKEGQEAEDTVINYLKEELENL